MPSKKAVWMIIDQTEPGRVCNTIRPPDSRLSLTAAGVDRFVIAKGKILMVTRIVLDQVTDRVSLIVSGPI
ncbi:MAG: hypothetical protein N0E44_21915 [Candidatus Thiodiazotropha lotti]|nr:hypothetical protein [Candidatus Thiodiazotropha lotti]MCW4222530.1 hypothetical protein [Candidatus Thiodiazotropha lotti]